MFSIIKCFFLGHRWSTDILRMKATTFGRPVTWECERCAKSISAIFPQPQSWDKKALIETMESEDGKYLKKLRRWLGIVHYVKMLKLKKEYLG